MAKCRNAVCKAPSRYSYFGRKAGLLQDGLLLRERSTEVNMAKELNLQDVFLNQSRKDRIPVTIYITNGFQFKGIVKGFDNYTVILDTDGKQNLIYKHAISTITPLRPISLLDAFEKDDADAKE